MRVSRSWRHRSGFARDFDAFQAALVLDRGTLGSHGYTALRSHRGRHHPNLKSFESLFSSGKPRCGQARDSQREFLFGPKVWKWPRGAGAARGEGRGGLLALGSKRRDAFTRP